MKTITEIHNAGEFFEETDLPLVPSNTMVQEVVILDNLGRIARRDKTGFSMPGHNHEDETLKAARIERDNDDTVVIGQYNTSEPCVIVSGTLSATRANTVHVAAGGYNGFYTRFRDSQVSINRTLYYTSGYSTALAIEVGKKAIATEWALYPCSIKNKTNIKPIKDALNKVKKVLGITFDQDGKQQTGISAEDLEKTGLPGAVDKESGQFLSINPMVMIPLLVECIKDLEFRVASLEQA